MIVNIATENVLALSQCFFETFWGEAIARLPLTLVAGLPILFVCLYTWKYFLCVNACEWISSFLLLGGRIQSDEKFHNNRRVFSFQGAEIYFSLSSQSFLNHASEKADHRNRFLELEKCQSQLKFDVGHIIISQQLYWSIHQSYCFKWLS